MEMEEGMGNNQALSSGRDHNFTSGFAVGAIFGVVSALAWSTVSRLRRHSVMRLEKSIQIGCAPHEVFTAWANFEQLPELISCVKRVRRSGSRSRWVIELGGKRQEWEAEVTQSIPNQSVGWKSVSGAQHTGRINFSSIGDDTQVHAVINYQPPVWARLVSASVADELDNHLEKALRDFKAALEQKGQMREPQHRSA